MTHIEPDGSEWEVEYTRTEYMFALDAARITRETTMCPVRVRLLPRTKWWRFWEAREWVVERRVRGPRKRP